MKTILALLALAFPTLCSAVTHTVNVRDFVFDPANLTISVGDQVTWNFQNSLHTTTSGSNCTMNGTWDSGIQNAGATFSLTFNNAGSFPYFCSVHCASNNMVGTITVSTVNSVRDEQKADKQDLNVYPNPFFNYATFVIHAEQKSMGTLDITTVDGKLISSEKISVQAGDNTLRLSMDIPAGIYLVRLQLEGTLPETKMIVKQEE